MEHDVRLSSAGEEFGIVRSDLKGLGEEIDGEFVVLIDESNTCLALKFDRHWQSRKKVLENCIWIKSGRRAGEVEVGVGVVFIVCVLEPVDCDGPGVG